ncbi:hypothetical protein FGADI_9283 [Fusarium gaditjirri]|uniref:Uncharacterized protein n=1 Tax=Fusarium gaditjirri TaxID=282569 RepID=A0A8H4T0I0_9HYPO|nr:hypothetical protein FGADI_9283 [Fusarium gaditjirri]
MGVETSDTSAANWFARPICLEVVILGTVIPLTTTCSVEADKRASINSLSTEYPYHLSLRTFSEHYVILSPSVVTVQVHMSGSSRHPSPRDRRRHRLRPERKEGAEKDYGAHKQTWSERLTKLGSVLIQIASLKRPIFGPPRLPPSTKHKYRHDPDRRRHRGTRTPSKGRHKSRHKPQRDRSYGSSRRKPLSGSETNPSEDQEDTGPQSTVGLSQVANTDRYDTFPKPNNNADAPLSPATLCPGHDLRTECTLDADIAPQTCPEQREKASPIAFVDSDSVDSVDSVGSVDSTISTASSSPQDNVADLEESQPEVSSGHGTPEVESSGPPESSSPAKLPAFLHVRSIVWRKVQGDYHPHVIVHIEREDNKEPIIWTCLCTSRPQLRKIREQYGETDEAKKNFICLGGRRRNPRGFETGGIEMPTDPEVEIQGPPMRWYTYLELSSCQAFGPGDFESLPDGLRQISPSSWDKVINQVSQNHTKPTWLQKKESSWERPRRATGNTHERIFT